MAVEAREKTWGTPYLIKVMLMVIEKGILPFCVGKAQRKKTSGMSEATLEDLAFPNRSTRESDGVRRRGCIEHDDTNGVGYD
jgi:hypothetical protein